MRNYYKISCIILVVILLFAVALYLIPWRTPIELNMYGAVITTDGQILDTKKVKVSGDILEYLFQSDRLDMDISLDESHWKDISTGGVYSGDGRWPYIFADWKGYNSELNRSDFGYLGLSFEKDMLILTGFGADDRYLVASVNSKFEPQEILQNFSQLID